MAERKYVYRVEVNTDSIAAAEAEIRQRLGGAMANIQAQPEAQRAAQTTLADFQKLEAELKKIGQVDLTAPADQLQANLEVLRQNVRQLDAEIRGIGSISPQYRAQADEYPGFTNRQQSSAEGLIGAERAATAARVEAEKRITVEARAGAAERAAIARRESAVKVEEAREARIRATEAEKRITVDARAEAAERTAIARRESATKIEEAREARIRATEEERRLTAEFRQQARERERATSTQRGRSILSRAGSEIAGAAMGALTIYGAAQAGRTLYEAGRLGAANLQLARSFDDLSERAGLTGDVLRNELRVAVQETVADTRLAAETNLLLAAAQQQNIQVTEAEIAKLAQLARLRSTQLTAQGKPLTTEEAYARLIRGTVKRETELLDELGLSTKQLADVMGVSVKEVNSSVDSLLASLLRVADIEIAKFGEPFDDEATRILQAETRIANAVDRLRAASAEPIAFTVELVADATESTVGTLEGLGNAWDQMRNPASSPIAQLAGSTRQQMRQAQDGAMGRNVTAAEIEAFGELRRSAEEYERALAAVDHAEVISQNRIFEGTRNVGERNAALNALHSTLTDLSGAYARMQEMEMAGTIDPATLAQAESEWHAITGGIQNGSVSIGDANNRIREMIGLLGGATGAASGLVGELSAVYDLTTGMGRAAFWADNPGLHAVNQAGGFGPGLFSSPDRLRADSSRVLAEQRAEQEQAASIERIRDRFLDAVDAQEKEYARAAERTAKAWESAAKEAESAFKSAVSGIPGIGSPSTVTEQDMELAKYGLYREKPDEYLRQVEDELRNGRDYAHINRGDIERMVAQSGGFDQGALGAIPNELLADLFREEWSSKRLFADPANLDLMGMDATKAALAQQQAGQRGENNLFDFLGASDLALPYGIGQEFGPKITEEMARGIRSAWPEAIAGVDIAGTAGTAIIQQFSSPAIAAQFEGVGKLTAEGVFKGYQSAIDQSPFASALVASITSAVMGQLIATFGEQNP